MIRKVLLSTVAFAAISGTALAADLPSRRAPPVFVPPPIPVFSWTGFYMGAQVGYAFGKDQTTLSPGALTPGTAAFQLGHPNGIIGGAHVGYNYALGSALGGSPLFGGFGGGGLVVGIEGDIDGTDYRSSVTFLPGVDSVTETSRKQIEGSVRGRLGIAVDRALFYATGGAAFTQFNHTYTVVEAGEDGGAPTTGFNSITHSRIGWTVGGGVEYAITTQFSLRAEYRYADFGSFADPLTAFAVTAEEPIAATHHLIQQRAQVGFSYKFDTVAPSPVVARY